jgi:DNA-binding beta-propeller fold protein YncE
MKRVSPIIGDKIKTIMMALFLSGFGSFLLSNPGYAEWRLFVVNTNLQEPSNGTLSVVRLSDSVKIVDIPLSSSYGGHSVGVHPNGLKAYVTGGTPGNNRGITVIDTQKNSITGVIPTAEDASRGIAFTPAGTDAYVCMFDGNVVRRVDTGTDSVVGLPIATHSAPAYIVITSDGTKAYVACNSGGFVDVIDLTVASPMVVKSVDLSSNNLQNLAFDPDESHLYVTDAGNNKIRVIRTSDDVEVTPPYFPIISNYPRAIAISDDSLHGFVGVREGTYANSVLVIRLSDGALVRQIVDADPLQGIANPRFGVLSQDGAIFYVTCHGGSQVAAINTSDYSFFYVPTGPNPVGLDIADVPVPLTVTSPNGGESWQRGKNYTVSWTYTGNPGPDVKIELLKGGVSGSTIASATPIGSGGNGVYSWPIPSNQATGSNYQIRITSTADSSITDTSDGNFTLYATKAPKITVKKPNGGEFWEAGTTQRIEWSYSGWVPGSKVKIELLEQKKRQGGFWTIVKRSTIATDAPTGMTGSYSWAIPSDQAAGKSYFIVVSSMTNILGKDVSDNPFGITAPTPPSITVTSPSGGETMQAGWEGYYNPNIQWKYTKDPGASVKVELLKGGGGESTVAASVPVGSGGTGSYYWFVPAAQAPGSDYKIRITSTTNSFYTDTGDGDFTITSAPTITVASANGGEIWQAGTTQTIQWAYGGDLVSGPPFDSIRIELLKGGVVYNAIASSVSVGSGSYAWTIPSNLPPGTDYRVRVTFLYYSHVTDTSDADFTITSPVSPSIRVTVPNGGEGWQAGTTHSIQWSYTGNPGPNVTIDLLKGGVGNGTIATNVSIGSGGAGWYSWAIPANQAAGTDYQVKLTTSAGNIAYTDSSDGYFSITASSGPSITVISPNGGENWQAGSTQTVSWSYSGDPGPNLNIELFKGGAPIYTIVTGISRNNNGNGSNGSIQWTIPSTLVSGSDYRIKITSTVNSSWTDSSDRDFTITNNVPASITVVVPNGMESWQRGTTHEIAWTYTGDPGPSVKIEGVLFTITHPPVPFTIAASTPIGSGGAGSYNWAIPSSLSTGTTYQITLTSTTNSLYKDTSDNFFSIVP